MPDQIPDALKLGGPYGPEATLYAAYLVAEGIRYLNHATRHHEAIMYPAEAYTVVQELSSAAGRLPQACDQVGTWAATEQAAGGIKVTHGEYKGRPDAAVMAFQVRLDRARAAFADAEHWLNLAGEVASTLAAAETGGGTDG